MPTSRFQAKDLLANQRVTIANAFHGKNGTTNCHTTSSKEVSNKVAHVREQQAFVVAQNIAIQIAAFDPLAEIKSVLLLNRDLS